MKKGGNVENTKFQLDPKFFFHFINDLLFSPRHPLESKGRFVNLFDNFSPLCAAPQLSALQMMEMPLDGDNAKDS